MKKTLAALACLLFIVGAQAQTTIAPGGGIFLDSSGSLVGWQNRKTGAEERFTATLGTGLTATSVVCVDAAKAFTSTCSSTTPSFAATTVTTLNGNTITAGTGTLTLGAGSTLATSATNSITLTSTGATNVTLPTTGTLSTLAGAEGFTNKTYNGNTFTAGTGTLTLAAGKTLTQNNSIVHAGTDGTTMTYPAVSGTLCASGNACSVSSVNFGGTTLSTYTEGTWTPALVGTGGSITNSLQVGHYTKIGRLVMAQYYVTGTKNTGTGPLSISGLPLASKNTANVYHNFPVASWAHASGTAFVNMSGQLPPASTSFGLFAIAAASTNSQTVTVNATDLSSAFTFRGTIVYQTD